MILLRVVHRRFGPQLRLFLFLKFTTAIVFLTKVIRHVYVPLCITACSSYAEMNEMSEHETSP